MLQREFGIGAGEAWFERPAWEIENLMERYVAHERAKNEVR